MKNMFEVWPGVLPPSYCLHIIDRAEKVTPSTATIGFDDGFREDKSWRRSIIRWLDPLGMDHDIATKLMQYAYQANRTSFGFDLWNLSSIQFTEYHASEEGHYHWHQDVDWENDMAFDRKLSVVIQLSDPSQYDGGEFQFQQTANPGTAFAPMGSVLVFPAFYTHRVTPVTRGVRRSLVTWIEGPKFR
jgi:PKHD-type hydroxylase